VGELRMGISQKNKLNMIRVILLVNALFLVIPAIILFVIGFIVKKKQ
jgi:hypothetical protein